MIRRAFVMSVNAGRGRNTNGGIRCAGGTGKTGQSGKPCRLRLRQNASADVHRFPSVRVLLFAGLFAGQELSATIASGIEHARP